VLESLFQFLFKYPYLVYQEGRFALGAPGLLPWAGLLTLALAAWTVLAYRMSRGRAGPRARVVLGGLRIATFVLLLFVLLRPGLTVSRTVPQENFVAILVDDSRSMAIADQADTPRGARAVDLFVNPESDLLQDLSDRFVVRTYAFGSELTRTTGPEEFSFAATETEMLGGLEQATAELSSLPLSGIVVVTDGGESGDRPLAEALLPIQRSGVPVFTVGMGRERLARDLELGRIEVPRTALVGSVLSVDVLVTQNGYDGDLATLEVTDDGRLVHSEALTLPGDGSPATARVRIPMEDAGPRTVRFRVVPLEGEVLVENNEREALVRVEDRRDRVLYVEGEPRWEAKFLRQSSDLDDNVQLVLYQRAGDRRFLRLGVESPEELLGGFPRTREELFRYRGLILGSVEADFFTPDQLSMIRDFVSQRGGGLLVLGGRRALGGGGFAGTPVADALPLVMGGAASAEPTEIAVRATAAGLLHPVTQIRDDAADSEAAWASLPGLLNSHPAMEAKPGATVLLAGDGPSGEMPVLAVQRFGRGRAAVLAAEDLWTWQFHHEIPVEDETHERLTRQLLRWLVEEAPRQVAADLPSGRVDPEAPVLLRATVDDSTYLERNDGAVVARVTAPSGAEFEVPLEWTVEEDGVYEAPFIPREEGVHTVDVRASGGDGPIGSDRAYLLSAPSRQESFEPGMRRALLERVARETDGRFYTEASVDRLPDELAVTGGGVTTVERIDIWDAPIFLLLLLGLLSAEWVVRRREGMI
jgi:uncharacterized membrane protein